MDISLYMLMRISYPDMGTALLVNPEAQHPFGLSGLSYHPRGMSNRMVTCRMHKVVTWQYTIGNMYTIMHVNGSNAERTK